MLWLGYVDRIQPMGSLERKPLFGRDLPTPDILRAETSQVRNLVCHRAPDLATHISVALV